MPVQAHSQMANFIWSICNLLRGLGKFKAYIEELAAETMERQWSPLLKWREKSM